MIYGVFSLLYKLISILKSIFLFYVEDSSKNDKGLKRLRSWFQTF